MVIVSNLTRFFYKPRVYIPTTGYMAPPPYQPIPYYETKPYTSGDSYQQYRYIPNDAY